MVEDTPPTIPLSTPEEGHSGSDPKEPPVGVKIYDLATEDHTPDWMTRNETARRNCFYDTLAHQVSHPVSHRHYKRRSALPMRMPPSLP
ncbi:hypothetical protein Tco_1270203 [Tanacetum coccineum]